MDRRAGFDVLRRGLSDTERQDLARQAAANEQFMLVHLRRALRWAVLTGVAVTAIYAVLWLATVTMKLDRTKSIVSSVAAAAVYVAACTWDLRQSWGRVKAVRKQWGDLRNRAEATPVIEAEVRPHRVWKWEYSWLFDLGDGRALLAEWDLPRKSASERIVARITAEGIQWIDQYGEDLPAASLDFDWDRLPDDHPLAENWGPAVFRLQGDPGDSIRAFADGSFPLHVEPRNSS